MGKNTSDNELNPCKIMVYEEIAVKLDSMPQEGLSDSKIA